MKNDGRILIAGSGLIYGAITVGGSLLAKTGLSAFDISFFFLSLSLIPLLPLVVRKNFLLRLRDSWRYLLAYSLANSGLVILQFESLNLGLAPAVSAFLLYTQPILDHNLWKDFLLRESGQDSNRSYRTRSPRCLPHHRSDNTPARTRI